MNSILTLEPQSVWFYFNEICRIPHPSKKEEKIVDYLIEFGKKHQLETSVDSVGNVLIRKKATTGMENKDSILFQSHMDMVTEKNKETVHDFDKDPIIPYVDEGWVKAHGTTLGADNGIGVAAQLALLASDEIVHGDIEYLFTVDEEAGMSGAKALQSGLFRSRRMINLDSEEDGVFCIGCAGGMDTIARFNYSTTSAPENLYCFSIQVKGLQGGHSGEDINKERGNAIKILARYLWTLNKEVGLYLFKIDGGNLHNAIPREASATVAIPFDKKEKARVMLNLLIHEIGEELPSEKNFAMDIESENPLTEVMTKEMSDKLIGALYACPHGVLKMSREMEGLTQTSTNLASIKMPEAKTIIVSTSQRSSVESEKQDLKNRIEALFNLAGAQVTHGDGYPGWKPNPDSKIKQIVEDSYFRLFHQKPVVRAIHAGLECGLIREKYPDMDMISIGPTIIGNHSPAEKVEIKSVEKCWLHLIDILKTC